MSILEVRNHIFEVKATGGDTFLGGVDFDQRLTEWVFYKFGKDHDLDLSKDPVAHQRILDACEQAKIELSGRTSARINIPYIAMGESGPVNIDLTVERESFEQLIMDLVNSTLKTCDQVLADAKIKPEGLDSVILVGGSTRIPIVATKVAEFFQKPLSKAVNPDEAVAIGAAILADTIARGRDQDLMLLDVLPITIGIKVGGNNVMSIFPRNSSVPNQKQKIFTTSKDNQASLTLSILQGDSPNAKECIPIGEFQFSGLRQALKGQARMEVTFTISPEGILSVSALDPDTGKQEKSIIQVSGTQSKTLHQNLIEPKKAASSGAAETVITRTLTRERHIKVPETGPKKAEEKPQKVEVDFSDSAPAKESAPSPAVSKKTKPSGKKRKSRPGFFQNILGKIFSKQD